MCVQTGGGEADCSGGETENTTGGASSGSERDGERSSRPYLSAGPLADLHPTHKIYKVRNTVKC